MPHARHRRQLRARDAEASWKRQFIDPIGQSWTPFAFAHLNGSSLKLDTTELDLHRRLRRPAELLIDNPQHQPARLLWPGQSLPRPVVPGAGVEYRYPFVAATDGPSHVVEPIAQVIVRPDEAQPLARQRGRAEPRLRRHEPVHVDNSPATTGSRAARARITARSTPRPSTRAASPAAVRPVLSARRTESYTTRTPPTRASTRA